MSDYARGETVYIRDFPLGKPSKIMGIIVGQRNDYYFVLIKNGLEEGKIKRYNFWDIYSESEDDEWID